MHSHLILAALSAVMLALAFPRPGWGWIAHVALVPQTILALRSTRPGRLIWTSYLVAVVWWLFCVRWLWPVTSFGLVVLCFYLALYTPAVLLTLRFISRRYRTATVLVLPIVWVSFEFMRGYLLAGGFGWFSLSHSQAPYEPADVRYQPALILIQCADLFGEHAVSFLVAMTNGLIVDLFTRPLVRVSALGKRRKGKSVRAAILLWLLFYVAAGGYGIWRIRQTDNLHADGLRIAVVQTNVPQDNKERAKLGQDETEWKRLVDLTANAVADDRKLDLVVWPETTVPVALNVEAVDEFRRSADFWPTITAERLAQFSDADMYHRIAGEMGIPFEQIPVHFAEMNGRWQTYRAQVSELADQLNTWLLVGAQSRYFEPRSRYYNSVYLFAANGTPSPLRYDKIHRVPFGEFIPWVENWPALKKLFIRYLTPYDQDYSLTAGKRYTVFIVDQVRIATPICFEDTVPRVCRRMIYGDNGAKGADLLVNVTNDGWFAGSSQGPQHLQIAVLRCIENRVPMARSVNTGISGFIDSVGRVGPLVEYDGATQQIDGSTSTDVRIDPRKTLFGRLGHLPIMIMVTACAVLVAFGLFCRKKG